MALKMDNTKLIEDVIKGFSIEPNTKIIRKVIVEDCNVGGFVNITYTGHLDNVIITGQVTASDTVLVRFINPLDVVSKVGTGKILIKIN